MKEKEFKHSNFRQGRPDLLKLFKRHVGERSQLDLNTDSWEAKCQELAQRNTILEQLFKASYPIKKLKEGSLDDGEAILDQISKTVDQQSTPISMEQQLQIEDLTKHYLDQIHKILAHKLASDTLSGQPMHMLHSSMKSDEGLTSSPESFSLLSKRAAPWEHKSQAKDLNFDSLIDLKPIIASTSIEDDIIRSYSDEEFTLSENEQEQ